MGLAKKFHCRVREGVDRNLGIAIIGPPQFGRASDQTSGTVFDKSRSVQIVAIPRDCLLALASQS